VNNKEEIRINSCQCTIFSTIPEELGKKHKQKILFLLSYKSPPPKQKSQFNLQIIEHPMSLGAKEHSIAFKNWKS
jgi:hypothetical protein